MGGEVPALVPSALGTALNNYRGRDRYSLSSSSASSTSWSVVTDEEDDDALLGADDEYACLPDGTDSIYEGSSKSANELHPMRLSVLSYARRPSGTNNRSTVPLLHRRTSSGSSSGHVHGAPRSAPIHFNPRSSAEEEEYSSDFGFSLRGDSDTLHIHRHHHNTLSERNREKGKCSTLTAKAKRSRNRASLPAYFSLLQTGGSPNHQRTSPVSSSSGNTIARPSPPTPKLTLTGLASGLPHSLSYIAPSVPAIHATPRGRRREPGTSGGSFRRSDYSRSRSPSRSHSRSRHLMRPPPPPPQLNLKPRSRLDSKGSVEQVFDWSNMPVARGRAAVRRNSSPPPKMVLSGVCMNLESASGYGSAGRTKRGRARADDLDGMGFSADAPGYGIGRSGLMDREKVVGARGAVGLR